MQSTVSATRGSPPADSLQSSYWNRAHLTSHIRQMPIVNQIQTGLGRSARILELGCGIISPGDPRIGRDELFIGVDISKVALDESKSNFSEGRFIVASGARMPFKSASFDTVVSFETLSILGRDFSSAISEMIRVSGRRVVFTLGHEDYFTKELGTCHEFNYGKIGKYNGNMDVVLLNEDSIHRLLRDMGERNYSVKLFNAMEWYGAHEDSTEKSHILVEIRR